METAQYLCEFFFCDGFNSFVRLCIIAFFFYLLSPKTYIVQNIGNDTEEENDED